VKRPKAAMSERKMTTKTTFVRSERMKKRTERKPIVRR
jgi:hypothetical protein